MMKKPRKPSKPKTLVGETFEIYDKVYEAVPSARYLLSLIADDRCVDCDIWNSPHRKSCGLLNCRTTDGMPLIWRLINE